MVVRLGRGDPAPDFVQRTIANPAFPFSSAAGRYIVLCFFGSAGEPHAAHAIAEARKRVDIFDDSFACFFGVSSEPEDELSVRVVDSYPGYRFVWDFDNSVARLYASESVDSAGTAGVRQWVVVGANLRILGVFPFEPTGSEIERVLDFVASLPAPGTIAGMAIQAPILLLPDIFETNICELLIRYFEATGGEVSGFMEDRDGRTVGIVDARHKSRRDRHVEDPEIKTALRQRIVRRILPEISKCFQFDATVMERYLVARYSADEGGHFRAHRDNTTKGTAHRRFAISINLNDDFDGGDIGFPEFGPARYRPPPGGAVVFSCSLLHEVARVERGRRYAFLPFLYDEAANRVRAANLSFVAP